MNRFSENGWSISVTQLLMVVVALIALATTVTLLQSDDSSADDVNATTFYYDRMSDDQKEIYDAMKTMTIEHRSFNLTLDDSVIGQDPSTVITSLNTKIDGVYSLFRQEQLYYYWMDGGFSTNYTTYSGGPQDGKLSSSTVTVTFTSAMTAYGNTDAQITTNVASINAILESFRPTVDVTSRYAKVFNIYNSLYDRFIYYVDKEHIPEGMIVRNIATAFLGATYPEQSQIVCEGYAKAFKVTCDYYGVPCIIVTGTGVTDSGSEGHMWNYVQMENGKWYLIDLTWDDQDDIHTLYHDFFLAGSATVDENFGHRAMSASHILDTKYAAYSVPTLDTDAYPSTDYVITFLNEDESTLSSRHYLIGDTVSVPTLENYDKTGKRHTFDGWAVKDTTTVIEIPSVSGDATYVPIFTVSDIMYTITFVDVDGTIVSTKTDYLYNDPIVVPTEFISVTWSPEVPAGVTEDKEFTATTSIKASGQNVVAKTSNREIQFSAAAMTEIKSLTGTLKINLVSGSVLFDNTAKQALNGDQTLNLEEKSFAILRSSVQSALKNAVVYSITFGTNNTVFEAGKATVSLNFTPRAGQDASNIMLYYVDGDKITEVPSSYADNRLTFTTNHFSTYAIQIPQETPDMMKLIQENWILIAILLFAVIGMALSYRFG